jgi:hypothetical protein
MTNDLQALTDRLDIADLLAAYSTALDTKDWPALKSVFTPEASCDYGSLGSPSGVEAIIDLVSATLQSLDVTQHLIGNVTVRVSGDRATAAAYLIAQHQRAGTPGGDTYLMGSTYTDELVRTPEGWRISHRTMTRLWATGNRDVIQRP